MSHRWHGVFPALWTPTDADGGLRRADLADQVRFLRAAGVDGVMVLGSTGEFVHLDLPVRKEILRTVAETAPGWPVIANCSDVSPRHVAELGRCARETGAAAVSLLPPWFFASSGADVAEFMVRGAEAAGLPLMIYNFPERTGHRLSLETVAAICDRVPVAGLKQSGAEFGYHRDLAALAAEKRFTLITGADTKIPEAFALGARGVVSGLCNALPEPIVAVFRATREGRPEAAAAEQGRLREFAAELQGIEFALDVAACMQARGRPTGEFKQVVSAATRTRFAEVVGALRGRLAAWGYFGEPAVRTGA
jgi:4-hydroxy-tetrahydrodipicolinate synthase